MGWDWFVALSLFIAVAGLTPGPNNILAMAIGFGHGYRKVLPHLFGVLVGFPVMLLLIGLVLRPVMEQYGTWFAVLKYGSIAYILYLAYGIATAPVAEAFSEEERATPVTFWQSVVFQWINPKAWAGALTTVTVYMVPEHYRLDLAIAVGLSMVSILVAISMWALIGRQFQRMLTRPHHMRRLNIAMAVMLVAAVGLMAV